MTTSTATKTKKAKKNSATQTANTSSSTPISDNVTETLHQSVDTLGEHVATAEEKISDTATSSSATMAEKKRQAKHYWHTSAVGKYTQENPVATAGIAFIAGVLLTSLLKRK